MDTSILDEHYRAFEWPKFEDEWLRLYHSSSKNDQLKLLRMLLCEYRNDNTMSVVTKI